MALDPNIALGIRPMELANPLAQYGQIAQIQNAQNQNALAQYQLGSAQRQEATQNALSDAYKSAFNPDTGKIDEQALIKGLAARNAGHLIPDIQAKLLTTQKEQGLIGKTKVETESAQFKLANDKLKHGLESLTSAPTPQDAIEKLNDGVTKGFFDMKTASAEALKLQNMTPQDYQKYRIEKILGLVDNKDRLTAMLPKVHRQDIGGSIANIQDNPMLPGYGQPVANMPNIAKTATIGEKTAQGQLGLAQQKFAFEQANPGFELKEAEDGSIVGVNKLTLQAFPVTIGGNAPAAAPMVPTAGGMPGPRVAPAGAVVQAIPGMTSVLDQAAPAAAAAPVAGGPRQLVGKGKTPPTEYTKQAMGILNTNDALEKMQDTMKNFKSSDMLNPTRRAELGQAHAATLLFAKELFNLGVLNGGDERIINSVINNPIDFSSTAVPIEAIRKQARDLQGVVERTNKNLSTVYKLPVLKLERKAPSAAENDIHSQADAILRGTP